MKDGCERESARVRMSNIKTGVLYLLCSFLFHVNVNPLSEHSFFCVTSEPLLFCCSSVVYIPIVTVLFHNLCFKATVVVKRLVIFLSSDWNFGSSNPSDFFIRLPNDFPLKACDPVF